MIQMQINYSPPYLRLVNIYFMGSCYLRQLLYILLCGRIQGKLILKQLMLGYQINASLYCDVMSSSPLIICIYFAVILCTSGVNSECNSYFQLYCSSNKCFPYSACYHLIKIEIRKIVRSSYSGHDLLILAESRGSLL